jgi:tetratricopeptide (TPR) repeat protein
MMWNQEHTKRGIESLRRFQEGGVREDLDRAIEAFEHAVPLFRGEDEDRLYAVTGLASALMLRYQVSAEPDDLARAVDQARVLVGTAPLNSPSFPAFMHDACAILTEHAQGSNDPDAIDEAIAHTRRALARTPQDSPFLEGLSGTLGNALRVRYRRGSTEPTADIEGSIAAYERALHAPAAKHRGRSLTNLSTGFLDRYQEFNRDDDLERAISCLNEALPLLPAPNPERSLALTNLGGMFGLRYTAYGAFADLERARDLHREALDNAPPTRRGILWQNLAGTLARLADERDSTAALDESLEAYQQAIHFGQGDQLAASMNGASTQLARAAGRLEGPARQRTLDNAVDMARQSVELTPPESPAYAGRLHNYGNRLIDRYLASDRDADDDLDEGLAALARAARETDPSSPEYARFLNSFATSMRERRDLSLEDYFGARSIYRMACHAGLRNNLWMAFTAGQNWGTWALRQHRWRDAAVGLALAMRAMERLLETQLSRKDKEDWLRHAQRIPANYAYVLAKRGHLERAVEVLENTRARLLSESLERRRSGGFDTSSRLPAILQALSPDSQTAGVYLLSSPAGSLALLVHDGTIEPIWLDYSDRALADTLYDHEDGLLVPQILDANRIAYISWALNRALPTIGEKVVAPIAAAVRKRWASAADPAAPDDDDMASRRTVVLIAAGGWGLMPLHAAPYDERGRCLLDDGAVRYTPSAVALMHARAPDIDTTHEHPFIGVSDPTGLAEHDRLQGAEREVRAIADLFGPDALVLPVSAATTSRVIEALAQTDCLHLACHGTFDASRPLQSGLRLRDGTVTAQALLAAAPRTVPRLVVMSACRSALTDPFKLPEEAIGLPAVFLEMGCTGVIGSLWSVDDTATSMLMRQLYVLGTSNGQPGSPMSIAHALRRAQLWLRAQPKFSDVSLWAAFTYQGHDVWMAAHQSQLILGDR